MVETCGSTSGVQSKQDFHYLIHVCDEDGEVLAMRTSTCHGIVNLSPGRSGYTDLFERLRSPGRCVHIGIDGPVNSYHVSKELIEAVSLSFPPFIPDVCRLQFLRFVKQSRLHESSENMHERSQIGQREVRTDQS